MISKHTWMILFKAVHIYTEFAKTA